MNIQLTQGQQAAFDAFASFVMDPTKQVMVVEGFSGTGKSTLTRTMVQELPKIMKTARLVHPSLAEREVILTATTNKACEALEGLTDQGVVTVQSFLGLRVQTDYRSGETRLVPRSNEIKHDALVFIDEASFVDSQLLDLVFKRTKHCKIVFIGDPAQLTPVKAANAPVFAAGFPTVRLTEVVRHDGPILELATKFRHTVETGEFFSFVPDGQAVVHLSREAFEDEIIKEFNRPDWNYKDSKVLAWTNKTVIAYNQAISDHVSGTPEFCVGDYGICNRFMNFKGGSLKTDQTVCVTHIGPDSTEYGVLGNHIEVDHRWRVFLPKDLTQKKAALKKARDEENYGLVAHIDNNWIDLRPAYACTINKSQGSTFKRVFIDLDDLKKCTHGDQLARLLYVGVSRASTQVVLTGDLV